MNKACASILIFIALFALVGAEDFKRLPLEQGSLRMRNLATATTPQYNLDNYTNNFGVRVNLSSTYLTAIGLDNNTQTDMTVFLYTNVTGFCDNCAQFVNFGCGSNNCSYDTTQAQTMLGPNYYVTSGYPFNFSNLTIGSDSNSSGWKLSTTAFYYTNGPAYYRDIYGSGYTQNYIRNYSTYGYIGLGVGGNASKNFQTANPIFSVSINGSGSGSLIFGKDTTLYDSKRTAITLNTDTNWTMTSRNMSLGPYVNNTVYNSSVIFDLQTPGISLPQTYYNTIWYAFYSKYNLTSNTTFGNSDYPVVYSGSLSNLPSLTFGLTNGQNITLPPSAYTRKLATDFYAILINYVQPVANRTSGQDVNYTVLGWSALSQFYTVFELPASGVPTVTMYPTYNATYNGVADTSSSSFSLKTLAIVAAVVLVVLVALSAVCKKKTDFTKSDLGVELRAARV